MKYTFTETMVECTTYKYEADVPDEIAAKGADAIGEWLADNMTAVTAGQTEGSEALAESPEWSWEPKDA